MKQRKHTLILTAVFVAFFCGGYFSTSLFWEHENPLYVEVKTIPTKGVYEWVDSPWKTIHGLKILEKKRPVTFDYDSMVYGITFLGFGYLWSEPYPECIISKKEDCAEIVTIGPDQALAKEMLVFHEEGLLLNYLKPVENQHDD